MAVPSGGAKAVLDALLQGAREIPAEKLRGVVRVVAASAVEDLLRRGGGDGETAARVAALETEREQLEGDLRRQMERVKHLEGKLREAAGGAGGPGAEPAGPAPDFLEMVEQPDYAGIVTEIGEARETLGRLEARFGAAPGEGVRQLATAILRALGNEDEAPAEASTGPTLPGADAIRSRLEQIEGELQRDGSALGILFEAMLDGNGTVSLVGELLSLVSRDQGYAGEVRSLRKALDLLQQVPEAKPAA